MLMFSYVDFQNWLNTASQDWPLTSFSGTFGATVVCLAEGELHILAVSVKELKKHLQLSNPTPSVEDLTKVLTSSTSEQLAGLEIYSHKIQAGDVYMIPQGFLSSALPINKQIHIGIRKAVITNTIQSKENYKILIEAAIQSKEDLGIKKNVHELLQKA